MLAHDDSNHALILQALAVDQMQKGFISLVSAVEDLTLDVPNASEILATFISRATVDEILPPSFVGRLPSGEVDVPDGNVPGCPLQDSFITHMHLSIQPDCSRASVIPGVALMMHACTVPALALLSVRPSKWRKEYCRDFVHTQLQYQTTVSHTCLFLSC